MHQHNLIDRCATLIVFCLAVCSAYLVGCTAAEAQRTEEIVVAPIGDEGEVTTSAMTREELEGTMEELYQELFNLRFQLATKQLANASRMGQVRRDIARAKTVMREAELAAEGR